MYLTDLYGINNIAAFKEAFNNHATCCEVFEKLRWPYCVISPFDSTSKVYKCSNNKYRCSQTGKYFNVLTKSIFHGTKLNLAIWFEAIWWMSNTPGISTKELSDKLQISLKTAWLIQKKLASVNQSEGSMPNGKKAMMEWLTQLK